MGAANLIPKLTNPDLPEDQRIDPDKWIREYTVQDWALVVKAFKEWPFAPDVSKDLISSRQSLTICSPPS
jgi:transcription factor 1